MKKRGQITIFIIVGVLIVVGVAFFFFFRQGLIPEIGSGKEINPNAFLTACLEEKIMEAEKILLIQGGSINPVLYKLFRFEDESEAHNISYLCYTQNYGELCINQQPNLINHLEEEIKNYLEVDDSVQMCFNDFVSSLEKQNYKVNESGSGFDVELNLGKIIIKINKELTLTKTDETKIQKNFGVIIPSKLYDLALISHEIINSEARFCEFNYGSYMIIYPKYDLGFFVNEEGEHIYDVKYRDTGVFFRFATRGCII